MLLVLELGVADLAATRFAISPLCETVRAVALLGRPDPPSANRPWVRWAWGEARAATAAAAPAVAAGRDRRAVLAGVPGPGTGR